MGMIMNGFLKVPMQFFILLVGVMVFVFYQFNTAPLNFNPAATQSVLTSEYAEQYRELENTYNQIQQDKQQLSMEFGESKTLSSQEKTNLKKSITQLNLAEANARELGREFIKAGDKDAETNDKDYVFIHFILNNLPRGLIGLLLAVILSAAMSSTASELNALASTTAIDIYRRGIKADRSEIHFLHASKWFTLLWGVIAITFASLASLFDNLIQLVNIIGSIFYGNVLGIFLLAFFVKKVRSNSVFIAAIITQLVIIALYFLDAMPYLWLNLVGCLLVMGLALIIEIFVKTPFEKHDNNE